MATRRKIKRLTRLKVREASLVDKPANPGARVLLWKADDELDRDLEALKVELRSILVEEPAAEQAELIKETCAWWFGREVAPVEHEEKVEMNATTQLEKMLKCEPGAPIPWTREEVYTELRGFAEELYPRDAEATAITKTLETRRGARLYGLYRSARPAPVARAAAVALSQADKIMEEIEVQAAALRAREPGLSQEKAISQVALRSPELYRRYREASR